jgi:hypothetical protein
MAWAIPLALIILAILNSGTSARPVAPLIAFSVPILAYAVLYFRFVRWPCPRCGKPFTQGRPYGLPYQKTCQFCGLPLWGRAQKAH